MQQKFVDQTVHNILQEYIEEEGCSVKSVDINTAISICQQVDLKLRRVKKAQLSDAILKSLQQLRETLPQERIEQDQPEQKLMTVNDEDTNKMNKATVDLWKIPPADMVAKDEAIEPKKKKQKTDKRKKEKDPSSYKPTSSVTLADLGGIDKIITQILELLAMPFSHPEIYTQLGSDIPRGVLLHGPPGCGKTMLANAIANELGVAFINISAPSIVSGMSGESEKKLREHFEEAKELAPCLIFIDEIDAITPKRESVQREMERRIVAQLLTCMDDVALEKTGGRPVMIIGATNRPDSIDPALRRGGRFDNEICMTVPDQDSREKILETISKKLTLEGDFDFKALAKMTPGYVGADLNALVAAAGVCAIKRIFGDLEVNSMEDVDLQNGHSIISRFLTRHPDPLTPEQLEPLAIKFEDFEKAIPSVQPSSKREGFATVPDVTWDDVGAMLPIREELEYAVVEPIRKPEIYAAAGISAPSGVLLWGPPGCGKTLLAKAVANESRANFISVRGPELLNKYVGESERAVRQVFTRARASMPCIIFFDELDALVPRRDDSNSESSSRVVNTLLTELDGVGDRKGVFVVAATNRPDMIDKAMLRPGRLDKQLFVELPTPEERIEILKTVSRKTPLDPSVDLSAIAHDARCENFSGADLAALVREATVLSLKSVLRQEVPDVHSIVVTNSDFNQAFAKIHPSVTGDDRRKYEELKLILAT